MQNTDVIKNTTPFKTGTSMIIATLIIDKIPMETIIIALDQLSLFLRIVKFGIIPTY